MDYQLIVSPWKNKFIETIEKTKKEILISSPFVSREGVSILSKAIPSRKSVSISLITNISPKNVLGGFTDPFALLDLYENFNRVNVSSLGRLHAKVYLIDDRMGIITSANLTGGGLVGNFEYGILIDDRETVLSIKKDMLEYYYLGNIFEKELLEKVGKEALELQKMREYTDELLKGTELERLLKSHEERVEYEILKNRVKDGKTINSIFAETILYILKKKGPLSTKEMHPLIQAIHPDICDDSIDRVINGQHFGKKWKHLVRDAQQFLKKKGLIYLKDGKWHLVAK